MAERARPWFPGGERVASFLVLVAVLYALYRTVRPLLFVLLLAAAAATLTSGLYRRIGAALGGRARTAAVATVALLFACLLGPVSTVGALALERLVIEIVTLSHELRANGGLPALLDRAADALGPLSPLAHRLIDEVEPALTSAVPELVRRTTELVGEAGGALVRIGIALFLGAITLYYLYLDGPRWRERLVHLLPIAPGEARTFLTRFRQVSLGVLVGNVGTAIAQGLAACVGFLLFGVPLPILWGLVTGIASFIPALGTLFVLGPITIYLALARGWLHGLGFGLYALVVIGAIDHVLRPLLTRTGLQIHPLAMFVAVIGGVATDGLAGVFLGPLVMALTITVLDLYEQRAA